MGDMDMDMVATMVDIVMEKDLLIQHQQEVIFMDMDTVITMDMDAYMDITDKILPAIHFSIFIHTTILDYHHHVIKFIKILYFLKIEKYFPFYFKNHSYRF